MKLGDGMRGEGVQITKYTKLFSNFYKTVAVRNCKEAQKIVNYTAQFHLQLITSNIFYG